MEIIKAVLFGIVEGITEWLPVSSTGHMILLDEFIQLKGNEEFINVFLVVIQLGAIFAVVLQFWNQLFPFQWKDKRKPFVEMDKMILWGKILLACIPAAIIGILFDSVFEELFYHAVPVAVALIVFGIAFIIIGGMSGLYGITLGLAFLSVNMTKLNHFGAPYLAPISPFSPKAMKDVLIRARWGKISRQDSRVQNFKGTDMDK